ncbi:MAG: methylenetetrahydrofolate reductase [Burkholderiales bacterium]
MNIIEKLRHSERSFSLEFFPPKKDIPITSVYEAIEKLSGYSPSFVSVTYGAGGSNRDRVIDIASHVKSLGLEALAHLTCVGADPNSIDYTLSQLESIGVSGVLALRGDVPEGLDMDTAYKHFKHASDLISAIKRRGGFCIGAAAYPEAHMESESTEEDISYMKLKAELGADFFITQLCFDSRAIIAFYENVEKAGIKAPVITGIMPIMNPNQITRMAFLSACSIPAPLSRIISRYGSDPDSFKKAGLGYAVEEIEYLMDNGIGRFHIYTMNKPDVAEQIILGSRLKTI